MDADAQTVSDMQSARRNCSIDVGAVRSLLYGGDENWRKRRRVLEIVAGDPAFDKSQRPFLSRKQAFERGLKIQYTIEELRVKHNWSAQETAIATSAAGEILPLNIQALAFDPVIFSQGSDELIREYGSLVRNRGITGCYLQTELGHGSNVARLETTATYIPEAEEFEINSPTLTSTKWWIGGLGKVATHGVVQAQLILPSGKNMGPHLFLVQLRSQESHVVLANITIGDIGPKAMAGIPCTDNGFARFNHVRIPKKNMLSKFAQVTAEGRYVRPPHAKLSYGGMLYIRSTMTSTAGNVLGKAATIAIRYATVRRQGNPGKNGLEQQVISYPSVNYRLLPILSRAYVFALLGSKLSKDFEEMSKRLADGDTSLLAETHIMISGLKVLVTSSTANDLETARRSMGGHGYSAFAGIGRLYADYVPSATYEGDNFVLDQQVVRGALKARNNYLSSPTHSLSPVFHFLRHLNSVSYLPAELDWNDWRHCVILLEMRAFRVIQARAEQEQAQCIASNSDQRVSRAVTEAYVASQVAEIISTLKVEGRDKDILISLFRLYLLTTLESALEDLLLFGLISIYASNSTGAFSDSENGLRLAISRTCEKLSPEAIGLTDAFGYTDWELDSALGVASGRVYQALWDAAQTEPLNHTELPSGYNEFIKPMLERGKCLAMEEMTRSKL